VNRDARQHQPAPDVLETAARHISLVPVYFSME
jgi:hypothetical protein